MKSKAMSSGTAGSEKAEQERIFIVDDDESVCRALGILLRTYGFAVETFASAEDFFSAIPNSVPGCLLLDIHMPGMDGWKVLERLIESGATRPVIVISADKHDINFNRALKSGAAAYLLKPFEAPVLVDSINRVMAEAEKKRMV